MASKDPAHHPRRRHTRTASAILIPDERSRAALNLPMYPDTPTTAGPSSLGASSPGASSSKTSNTATKIINSMRRQFTFVKRREADIFTRGGRGMYSTPEERSSVTVKPSVLRYDDPDTRPTPEQIAMGLHLSRTPHIRPLGASQSLPAGPATHVPRIHGAYSRRPYAHSNRSASPVRPPPPPPPRSSLRAPGARDTSGSASPTTPVPQTASTASLSGSTATSTAPSTPRSSRAFFPLKIVGMSKFLTSSRASSISDSSSAKFGVTVAADSSSTSTEESSRHSRRKSVRFTDSFS